jgi:tetratricopeptide (TPR) repeat protein
VALAAFDEALARDARAVEQPLALYDLAQAQRLSGKNAEALASYRVLVPRASLLPTRTLRAQVLLEAAHVAMLSGKPAERDEALAYLREAAHDPHHALRLDVALSLVLTLDRAGRRAQADAILAEQRGSARFVTRDAPSYLANFDDLALLRALSLEISDPAAAREHYQRYLASPSGQGAYADAARARSARLTTKRGR